MTTFHLVERTPSTSALAEMLVNHGATPAFGGELLVLAPSSLQDARERLGALNDAERACCLLVGLEEPLSTLIWSPNSLSALLDDFLPLGVLNFSREPQRSHVFGFIGKKSLAEAMGSPIGKAATSRYYGGYMMTRGEDAGAFVLRYLRTTAVSDLPHEIYVAYLRSKDRTSCAQQLSDALVAVGRGDLSMLWRAWCSGESRVLLAAGAWRDRTVHLGNVPPQGVAVGDLWFDVCELSLMVRVGSVWLATRPTAVWQMHGFVDLAPHERGQSDAALDPKRLYAHGVADAVTNLTFREAVLYASWFGKTVPRLGDWQSANTEFTAEQMESLWVATDSEWTSTRLNNDATAQVLVTPTTIDEAARKLGNDDASASLTVGAQVHRDLIGFRTVVVAKQDHELADREDLPFAPVLDRTSFDASASYPRTT